jgi:CDP-diacylglycerol--glycerol-3-phosphate 3-phosphatidyltransferase
MNISNSLSILRIILAFPVAYYLWTDQLTIALIIAFIAAWTDYFDGYFARKLNQITELGKILDPIADKIMLAGIAAVLLLKNILPLWFVIALILRDVIIISGGIYSRQKLHYVLPSNMLGKTTFCFMLLVILGIILKIDYCDTIGLYVALLALIYSLTVYAVRMFKELKKVGNSK